MAKKQNDMSKTYIIIAIIIGLAILGYGYMDYSYKNKALEQKGLDEFSKQKENETKYENCINNAYRAYMTDWNIGCDSLGKDNSCSLDIRLSKPIEDTRREREKDCLYRFGK